MTVAYIRDTFSHASPQEVEASIFSGVGSETSRNSEDTDLTTATRSVAVETPGADRDNIYSSPFLSPSEAGSESALLSLRGRPMNGLPEPDTVFATFAREVKNENSESALLLTRLFYAIGSPTAFCQLRDALRVAHQSTLPRTDLSSNQLMSTIESLDRLDSVTGYAHILRRFLLVRLLNLRLEREAFHRASTLTTSAQPRLLKYDLARIETIKEGRDAQVESHYGRKGGKPRKRRADSKALIDLLTMLHPEASDERQQPTSPRIETFPRKLSQLRHRLASARNWFTLSEAFTPGILALIPRGGDSHISVEQ